MEIINSDDSTLKAKNITRRIVLQMEIVFSFLSYHETIQK